MMKMIIELTITEAKIIVYEIVSTFTSLQYPKSESKKGGFKFKNFDKFDKSDFHLKEAEITAAEFKAYFNILREIKKQGVIK